MKITQYADSKIKYMAKKPKEVSGYGILNNDKIIVDFEVLTQTSNGTYTEHEGLEIAKMLKKYKDKGYEPWQVSRVWIHTHPGMGVTPSIQDNKTFDTFKDNDWAAMIICNGTMYSSHIYHRDLNNIYVDDIEIITEKESKWDKEYEEKVKDYPGITPIKHYQPYWNDCQYDYWRENIIETKRTDHKKLVKKLLPDFIENLASTINCYIITNIDKKKAEENKASKERMLAMEKYSKTKEGKTRERFQEAEKLAKIFNEQTGFLTEYVKYIIEIYDFGRKNGEIEAQDILETAFIETATKIIVNYYLFDNWTPKINNQIINLVEKEYI